MGDVPARLTRCFQAIFPDLRPDDVVRASPTTVPAWDSVASVTLLSLIEEEFGLAIELDDLNQFTSFESLQRYLQSRARVDNNAV